MILWEVCNLQDFEQIETGSDKHENFLIGFLLPTNLFARLPHCAYVITSQSDCLLDINSKWAEGGS